MTSASAFLPHAAGLAAADLPGAPGQDSASDLDRINRRMYGTRSVVEQCAAASGWLDEGERVSMRHAARGAGGGKALDIGAGGGRTAPLLHDICAGYVGVDYTPDMVHKARRRFPRMDFREMDARNLAFPDASFRLVNFSYNGIDSVDLEGRVRVIREAYRVLEPGGVFVFSALNRHGPAHRQRLELVRGSRRGPAARLLMPLLLLRRAAVSLVRRYRNRGVTQVGENVSVLNIPAHNYALVAVFVSVREQVRQLHNAGFAVEAVYDDVRGEELPVEADNRTASWCYYVARKPAESRLAHGPGGT